MGYALQESKGKNRGERSARQEVAVALSRVLPGEMMEVNGFGLHADGRIDMAWERNDQWEASRMAFSLLEK